MTASALPHAGAPTGIGERRLLPLVACVASVLMMHWPILASGFRLTQVEIGDSRLINYLLEHSYRFVTGTGGVDSLWEMPMFWPHQNVGAYTDTLIGVSPPYVLARWLGALPDTAFQIWMLALTVLNFVAFFWFARTSLRARSAAAAFGALLYAAAASRANFLYHPQLLCGVYIVLAALAIERLFRAGPRSPRRERLWIAVLAGAGVAQCYSGFYFAFFLAIGIGLAALLGIASRPLRQRAIELLRERAVTLAVAALVSGALLLHAYTHFKAAADESGFHDWNYVTTMLPRWQSWLYMGQHSLLFGWCTDLDLFESLPAEHEHRIGIGWLTLGVVAAGLLRFWQRPGYRILAVVTALGLTLPTYYDGWSAWQTLFDHLPAAGAIRGVTRISLVLLFPAAIGLTLCLANGRWRLRAVVALGLLCTAEQLTAPRSYDKLERRKVIADLVSRIPEDAEAFYVTRHGTERHEISASTFALSIDAIWASIASGTPTVNGYSGKFPPDFSPLDQPVLEDGRQIPAIEARLSRWATEHGVDRSAIHWVQYQAANRGTPYNHASRITSVDLPPNWSVTGRFSARVEAKNTGRRSWHATGRDQIRLGGRLFRGGTILRDFRGDLPHNVPPGQSVVGTLPIDLCGLEPGTSTLRVSLIREHRYWFEDLGSPVFERTIEITP